MVSYQLFLVPAASVPGDILPVKNGSAILVKAIVSLGALAAGIYVVATVDWNMNPEMGATAAGWVGLILGHWLR
jgi:hypothetical protein